MSKNAFVKNHVELFLYKDYSEIEVLARWSKNGAIGQNILCSFSSNALNFHGPN